MAGGRIDILVAPDFTRFGAQMGAGLAVASQQASRWGRGIAVAFGAGAVASAGLAVGLSKIIGLGNQYTQNLHIMQAVSQASSQQMAAVAARARELGSDLRLPATSAADAAEVMVELSKAGLSVGESMTAARGSIQLAAAAGIKASEAAAIQARTLNQYGLAAEQASHVADVLANAANAASGEVTDMALALQYIGPIAAGMGITVTDTATAVGLLANNGILAERAGTALRGMLSQINDPSKQAAQAMEKLGIEAYNAQGKFVGLRELTAQLADAQGRMTDEMFNHYAVMAFGREPLSAVLALTRENVDGYDAMSEALSRVGGAQELAAARTRGLYGALDKLQSQVEDFAIGFYETFAGQAEKTTLALAKFINDYGDNFNALAKRVVDDATTLGKEVLGALKPLAVVGGTVFAGLGSALSTLIHVFAGLPGPVQTATLALIGLRAVARTTRFQAMIGGLRNWRTQMQANRATMQGLAVTSAASYGRMAAAIDGIAAKVPVIGQMQTAYRQSISASRAAAAATGRYSTALADTGSNLIRFQGAVAASTIPLAGFGAKTRAAGAALRTGLGRSIGGLVGVLGGPWGIAITAAVAGLTWWINKQEEAARATQEHRAAVEEWKGTLDQTSGAITQSTLALARNTIGTKEWVDEIEGSGLEVREFTSALAGVPGETERVRGSLRGVARAALEGSDAWAENKDTLQKYGVGLDVVTDAALGNAGAQEKLNVALTQYSVDQANAGASMIGMGIATDNMKESLFGVVGAQRTLTQALADAEGKQATARKEIIDAANAMDPAKRKALEYADAIDTFRDSTASATDRARAFVRALELMAGDTASVQEATATFNRALNQVEDSLGEVVNKTEGWGDALIKSNGLINTTSENGLRLYDRFIQLRDGFAQYVAAQREQADRTGDVAGATERVLDRYDQLKKMLYQVGQSYGVSTDQIDKLLAATGLLPEKITTQFKAVGLVETVEDVEKVTQALEEAGGKPVSINLDVEDAKAIKAIQDAGHAIAHLPDGSIQVHSNVSDALAHFDELGMKVVTLPDGRLVVGSNTEELLSSLDKIGKMAVAMPDGDIKIGNNVEEVAEQVTNLGMKLVRMPDGRLEVRSNAEEVAKEVAAAGQAAVRLPGGYISIYSNADEARTKLKNLYPIIVQMPDGTFTVHHNIQEVKKQAADLGYSVVMLPDGRIAVYANAEQAFAAVDGVNDEVRNMPNGSVFITADTSQARNAIAHLIGQLEYLQGTASRPLGGITMRALPGVGVGVPEAAPLVADRARALFAAPDTSGLARAADRVGFAALRTLNVTVRPDAELTRAAAKARAREGAAISQTIVAQPRQSEYEIGRIAASQIMWEMRSR